MTYLIMTPKGHAQWFDTLDEALDALPTYGLRAKLYDNHGRKLAYNAGRVSHAPKGVRTDWIRDSVRRWAR